MIVHVIRAQARLNRNSDAPRACRCQPVGLRLPVLAGLLLGSLCAPPDSHAATDDLLRLAEALRAYRMGEPAEALPVLEKYAERGNARAAFGLATMYWRGAGTTTDRARARQLFRASAEAGSLHGALAMTSICGADFKTGRDSECAQRWLGKAVQIEKKRYFRSRSIRDRLAKPHPPIPRSPLVGRWLAEHGDREGSWRANYFLALLLETGHSPNIGVNARRSIKLMVRASEQGSPMAQTYIGELLVYGHRLKKDLSDAVEWYEKAARSGFAPAQARLGVLLVSSSDDIEYGTAENGLALLEQAAKEDVTLATHYLGFSYKYGRGVGRDYAIAVRWLKRSASQGFAASESLLGFAYFDGDGVPRNQEKAYRYLRRASRENSPRAQTVLAELLSASAKSSGRKKPLADAYTWLYFVLDDQPEQATVDTREWAQEIRNRVSAAITDEGKKQAEQQITRRRHGLSFVRTRTSWCVRIDGTLCAF